MTEETKQLMQIHLTMLKQTMKENGVMFALAIDKKEPDKSLLWFMDCKKYFESGEADGFSVSITEFNKGLL